MLFVKYIFFDKSETFPTSTPTPCQSQSRFKSLISSSSLPPSSASCPYQLSDRSESSVVHKQGTSLSVNIPDYLNESVGSLNPKQLRRLLNEQSSEALGIELYNTKREMHSENGDSRLALPPIEEAVEVTGSRVDQEDANGRRPVSLTKTQSSLASSKLGPLQECVTVGVQTDGGVTGEEQVQRLLSIDSGIVFGGNETPPDRGSETPLSEQSYLLGQPSLTPRPLEECLAIFKSEVYIQMCACNTYTNLLSVCNCACQPLVADGCKSVRVYVHL